MLSGSVIDFYIMLALFLNSFDMVSTGSPFALIVNSTVLTLDYIIKKFFIRGIKRFGVFFPNFRVYKLAEIECPLYIFHSNIINYTR